MTPAGYSGTQLAQKLGYRDGMLACILNPPAEYAGLPEPLPMGITFANDPGEAERVPVFARKAEELSKALFAFRDAIQHDGMIWISWPKRASKVSMDFTEDTVRAISLAPGFVDVNVCAINKASSGLKWVIRKEPR